MPTKISKLADIDPRAEIASDVEIGPFCVIKGNVKIGRGTKLLNSVTISGNVTIGEDNLIHPNSVLGGYPQDVSYRGAETRVKIGDRNVIRECVTINRATEKENGETIVGNDCYLMGSVHVAHDCIVSDNVILGHCAMLGGHVRVDHHTTLAGGGVCVHHWASIGRYAFVGAAGKVLQDIPPFMLADGFPAKARTINIVALKRNDFDKKVISALGEAFRLLYRARVGLNNAIEIMNSKGTLIPEIQHLFNEVEESQNGRHGRGREARNCCVKPLRIAVIGAGHLGRIHARLIQTLPQARLVAVADPSPAAQQSILEQHEVKVFCDFRKLVGQIDAAIVATPTRFHFDVASHLIENGIHVLIEKPLTDSVSDAEQLVELAANHDCVVQVGHVERFNAAIQRALAEVGQPKYIIATRMSGYTFRSIDIGVVHDLMIHDIDLVNSIFPGRVNEVRASGFSVFGRYEDMAQARVQFECGGVANLTASRCSFAAERNFQIFGTRGYANVNLAEQKIELVQVPDWIRNRSIDVLAVEPEIQSFIRENLFSAVLPRRIIDVEPVNAILEEQSDWLTAIEHGTTNRITVDQGMQAVAVADEVIQQINQHSWSGNKELTGPLASFEPDPSGSTKALPEFLTPLPARAA